MRDPQVSLDNFTLLLAWIEIWACMSVSQSPEKLSTLLQPRMTVRKPSSLSVNRNGYMGVVAIRDGFKKRSLSGVGS